MTSGVDINGGRGIAIKVGRGRQNFYFTHDKNSKLVFSIYVLNFIFSVL